MTLKYQSITTGTFIFSAKRAFVCKSNKQSADQQGEGRFFSATTER
jgi:hypothetical protein